MPQITELEEIRKNQIIEAAIKTISEKGVSNVTMADIAKRAKLSKGGLAHYFQTKEQLFNFVFKVFFERIFQTSRENMDKFEEPLDKILSFEWLFNADDEYRKQGYPILFDFMSLAVHNNNYKILFYEWVENWVEMLKAALEDGVNKGVFKDIEPDSTARTISAIYQGIATRWYLASNDHPTSWAVSSFRKTITNLLL